MEHEKRKRGREEEEDNKKEFILKSARRQDGYHHINDYDYDRIREEETCSSDNKYSGLGVFDFPWLHDEGMIISKSSSEEYWNFQDTFSSSLLLDACTELPDVEFSNQFFYEIPTNNSIVSSFPENKSEDNIGEDDSVDCIWSSLLNQPLQHVCI